jgi:hypothetical protein
MAIPLGAGWWKCCSCNREVKIELYGKEKCPDCAHPKCTDCEDPFDGYSDWADLTTTQSHIFDPVDNATGPVDCGRLHLEGDKPMFKAIELKEAVETGPQVKSSLPLK